MLLDKIFVINFQEKTNIETLVVAQDHEDIQEDIDVLTLGLSIIYIYIYPHLCQIEP